VYKLDSFVGFIGDEQVHAQECYDGFPLKILNEPNGVFIIVYRMLLEKVFACQSYSPKVSGSNVQS
jgi:hypothetical protein